MKNPKLTILFSVLWMIILAWWLRELSTVDLPFKRIPIYILILAFSVFAWLFLTNLDYLVKKSRDRIRPKILVSLTHNSITIKGKNMAAELLIGQFIEGSIEPKTARDKPAEVDQDSVVYTSSDENVFTVEKDPADQLKFKITSVGLGVAQLNISADADLDDGDNEVKPISTFVAVAVIPEEAAGFGITLGPPQDV